jgi:pyridoxamine 5'-phosphate oxidase
MVLEHDPIEHFRAWLRDAEAAEPNDPNAMALATVDRAGNPSVRMVLLKDVDERGFVFYTNLGSRKAREIAANSHVALCFHWKSSRRQVRVEGRVEGVADGEADAYFASRPRISQIGAWASKQSQPLEGRFELERRVAWFASRYAIGAVPRPDFWSGYRVRPAMIEFWEDRPFRLHMRRIYRRDEGTWTSGELYP